MADFEIYWRLGLALAIGLLLGLERGWHSRAKSEGGRTAGIRTFALTGLFGGVAGWIATLTAPMVLGLAFLAHVVLVAVSYAVRAGDDKDYGITTEVAQLLAFALGAASVLGAMAPAAATAVAAAILLSIKQPLHGWVENIRRLELFALFKLAVLSVVILPLLPDRGFGPGGTLNPYELWWAVVVVAGLSFFGYVAIRVAGPQLGVLITGLFGGLASSTSTTLAFSRMARMTPALGPVLGVGVVVAGSVTFLRILAVAAIFAPRLVPALAVPMVAMAATGLAGAAATRAMTGQGDDSPAGLDDIPNPLELRIALSFGAFLTAVVLLTHYLREWLGTTGIYAAAAMSGVADVDAVTISIARMPEGDIMTATAAGAIWLAVSVNTVVKGGIAVVVGGTRFGLRVAGIYALVIAAGAAALWLV